MRALYKFDPKKKYALSTYATFWIRAAVQNEISDSGRTIHMADNAENDVTKLIFSIGTFLSRHGREPTEKELATLMNKKISRIRELRAEMPHAVSLDQPVFDTDDSHLGELVEDGTSPRPDHEYTSSAIRTQLTQVLSSLSEEERTAILLQLDT